MLIENFGVTFEENIMSDLKISTDNIQPEAVLFVQTANAMRATAKR